MRAYFVTLANGKSFTFLTDASCVRSALADRWPCYKIAKITDL